MLADAGLPPGKATVAPEKPVSEYYCMLRFTRAQRENFETFIEMLQHETEEPPEAEVAVLDALRAACQGL